MAMPSTGAAEKLAMPATQSSWLLLGISVEAG